MIFSSHSSRQRGFSLTELLVVVAIMALLVSLGLPAMGVGRAKVLNRGGNLVVDLAHQARENSISKGCLTAIVLVTGTDVAINNRLFQLVEFRPEGTGWMPLTTWQMLPKGVVVDAGGSSASFFTSPTLSQPIGALRCGGRIINASAYVYQVFSADGRPLTGASSDPPSLRLVEGVMKNLTETTYTGVKSGAAPANYYDVTLNVYTGIPKIDRP